MTTSPRLVIYMDPGDAPQELITEYYLTLDALYRSLGGSGLKIVATEQVTRKRPPAPPPPPGPPPAPPLDIYTEGDPHV